MKDKLFYEVYDYLFFEKNYIEESEKIFELGVHLLGRIPTKILEIGCGTGNHTLEFAKRNIPMTAIDVDPEMINCCREKLSLVEFPHLQILNRPVELITESNFDLIFCFFNVVTYIQEFDHLVSFFRGVYRALSIGGVFLFDAWNGIAAILDPPGSKNFKFDSPKLLINAHLQSQSDFFRQVVRLTYHIEKTDRVNNTTISGDYSILQSLWTPNQLSDALHLSGFNSIRVSGWLNPDEEASEKSWKIMVYCQK